MGHTIAFGPEFIIWLTLGELISHTSNILIAVNLITVLKHYYFFRLGMMVPVGFNFVIAQNSKLFECKILELRDYNLTVLPIYYIVLMINDG